jgi:hypothetical protein
MAYIKPKMNVFFANGGQAITATIDKVAFRKYWAKPYKCSKTGETKRRQKSMPFAVCRVILSYDSSVQVGEEFLIAGYQLENVVIKNEKMLTFKNDYVAEYAKDYGNEWVRRIINESR